MKDVGDSIRVDSFGLSRAKRVVLRNRSAMAVCVAGI
jgi:hypothetical protein